LVIRNTAMSKVRMFPSLCLPRNCAPRMRTTLLGFRLIALLALWASSTATRADDLHKTPLATAAETLKIRKDFRAELLYSVPKDRQGSWINLCVDPKGRLIVSDQYGPLYRITPPPVSGTGSISVPQRPANETKVEK